MTRTFEGMGRRTFLGVVLAAGGSRLTFSQDGSRMKMMFHGQTISASLRDSATVRDLLSLMPLELTLEDYGGKEKIGYLKTALSLEGSGPFSDEAAGDICYWAPWRTLSLFYAPYRYSEGLVRLGRWDGDFSPLCQQGAINVRFEAIRS